MTGALYEVAAADVDAAAPAGVDLDAALADGCLGVRDAARFAGVGRSRLYEAIGAGELTIVKVGRRTLVPRRSLVSWLRARAARGRH